MVVNIINHIPFLKFEREEIRSWKDRGIRTTLKEPRTRL